MTTPEWPLDAPQREYDPADDAMKSYYAAIEAKRLRGDAAPVIDLAVASPVDLGKRIKLSLTMGGKTEMFIVKKHVAASLIVELARALANSA